MTHVTCRLTAKNRNQLRDPTLGNRVWDTFTVLGPTCCLNEYDDVMMRGQVSDAGLRRFGPHHRQLRVTPQPVGLSARRQVASSSAQGGRRKPGTAQVCTANFFFHFSKHHNQPFNGLFSRTTWVSRYQKGKTNLHFTGARVAVSGSGISWAICKSAPRSRQITMPVTHHSVFLQAGCPSCRPTNSVKSLK